MKDSDKKEDKKGTANDFGRLIKSLGLEKQSIKNVIPSMEELSKFTPIEPEPKYFASDLSSHLPKYFSLTTEELKTLSNNDLYNVLQDEFSKMEDTGVKQKILMKYPDHHLHDRSRDTAKEILADRRTEPKPQSFWQRIDWYWNTLISGIIASIATIAVQKFF